MGEGVDASEHVVHPVSGDRTPRSGSWRNERTEILSVILLSIASVAAAWCGYQASLWSGQQATYFSQANAKRIEASQTVTTAYLFALGDSGVFNGWAEAYATGDEQLMQFYENRFSDELKTAVDAWIATDPLNNPDAPRSPMAMPEYRVDELEHSTQLDAEAATLFDQGQEANDESDSYVLSTVIFATVLFFAGLATQVTWFPARTFAVAMSASMLLFGILRLALLPLA